MYISHLSSLQFLHSDEENIQTGVSMMYHVCHCLCYMYLVIVGDLGRPFVFTSLSLLCALSIIAA